MPTPRNFMRGINGILLWLFVITALPGWLMTAFAISLGAPFWFGLLQNVVNLRNAGAKPNRAADQPASGGSA